MDRYFHYAMLSRCRRPAPPRAAFRRRDGADDGRGALVFSLDSGGVFVSLATWACLLNAAADSPAAGRKVSTTCTIIMRPRLGNVPSVARPRRPSRSDHGRSLSLPASATRRRAMPKEPWLISNASAQKSRRRACGLSRWPRGASYGTRMAPMRATTFVRWRSASMSSARPTFAFEGAERNCRGPSPPSLA